MLELMEATSRALARNDVETLERLADRARSQGPYGKGDRHEMVRVQATLSAQIDAIAAHLALRSAVLSAQTQSGRSPWEL
jgi:hypothetical protein